MKADGQICEPKSTYKEDCNTCQCSENGKFAACTQMLCLPKQQHAQAAAVCNQGDTKMEVRTIDEKNSLQNK